MSSYRCLVALAFAGCVQDNSNAPNALVRVDPELPGENCPDGGVVIHTGRDTSRNGMLEDGEITASQFVCSGSSGVRCGSGQTAHDGTVVVRDASDFNQLAGINCVDGDLIISGIAGEIAALPDLQTVTGGVIVAGNVDLTSLDGLSALTDIGQSYLIQGNDSLDDISMVADLDNVLSIFVVGNNSLHDLAGLAALTELEVSLTISNNPALTSLHGLENLYSAKAWLALRANRSLTDLSALQNLRSASAVDISGNATLPGIQLPNLEKVSGRLIVDNNPALTNVSLPQLITLGDIVAISGNPTLTSISLPLLVTTGAMTINNNISLTNVDATSLGYVTTDLYLSNMPSLTAPNFNALKVVGGTLRVYYLSPFSFADFAGLSSVGNLWVLNSGLVDFSGLSSLGTVAGDMTVSGDSQLMSFSGLDAMTDIGGNLTISNNAMLSPSVAQDFASQVTVHGNVTIN